MKAIQDLFLKAKHWHIFVVLVAIPYAIGFMTIGAKQKVFYLGVPLAMTFVFGVTLLAWYRSVASFSLSRFKPQYQMNQRFFKVAMLSPLLWVPIAYWLTHDMGEWANAVMIPLHLVAMGCMFYILNFVSKSLVMAETGNPTSPPDYLGTLLMFWMFPIGVWFVQPRVNRLYDRSLRLSAQ